MQLEFQLISKPNAQVIDTYIGVIILFNRLCTGLALSLLLSARVSWALGQLPTNLLLRGLPLRLLWLRNHLLHNLLRRGCYTYAYAYAYDMRECIHDL